MSNDIYIILSGEVRVLLSGPSAATASPEFGCGGGAGSHPPKGVMYEVSVLGEAALLGEISTTQQPSSVTAKRDSSYPPP